MAPIEDRKGENLPDLDTAIIGPGPYGLSIAAHLRAKGMPFRLFGSPMESWHRYMPAGMILKSERFASNLWDPNRLFTLERFCQENHLPYRPVGDPLPLSTFLKYAAWFQTYAVGDCDDVRITSIRHHGKGFVLIQSDGTEFSSRRVILATGYMAFSEMPPQLRGLPQPLVSHSSRMQSIESYAGRHVTIIGAGQSALETAALLHERGAQVRILVQQSRIDWNTPSRLRSLPQRALAPDGALAPGWSSLALSEFPGAFRMCFSSEKRHSFVARSYRSSCSWWLRHRLENNVEVHLKSTVEKATVSDGRLEVVEQGPQGRCKFTTDHIIAGTGFKVDIDRLDYLDPALRQSIVREGQGIPSLSPQFETSVPGLFMVGAASSPVFGPIMRFMYGAKHVGPILSRRLSD